MKLTVLVPEVSSCTATQCGYNVGGGCHAKAITVGDATHPHCDTFLASQQHTHARERAGVGACKMTACRYNRDLECGADSIRVEPHESHADCATFAL
ncbi:MAG: DUF1540 domain-containing protein [Polyangiaceae bacterium]|nr:DUF1540 domain-containing protein [Polyangiaceae bacterium]